MPGTLPTYSLPKWTFITWLTEPGRNVPLDIRIGFIAVLFTSPFTLLLGSAVNLMVNITAVVYYPRNPFISILLLDLILLFARIILLQISHRSVRRKGATPTDIFIVSSLMWCGVIGAGTAICFATGDPGLQFLAPTTMVGIAGGIAMRNNRVPRLAVAQVILCYVPMQFVIPFMGSPGMLVSLLQCPLFLISLMITIHRLHQVHVAALVGEKDSEWRATHDNLTGLLNRAGLMSMIKIEMARRAKSGRALSLLYIDLDGFKSVNDSFGHPAGDELLRQVAERITASIPETCGAARLGGDEFVILAPDHDAVRAMAIGNAVMAALRHSFEIGIATSARVGASIGISSASIHSTADTLVAEADVALYEVKMTGKGRCVVAVPPVVSKPQVSSAA